MYLKKVQDSCYSKDDIHNPHSLVKLSSNNSITLRIYSFSRILYENFGYSFVFNKEKRKSSKGLSNYAIDKIYNNNLEIIYDENNTNITDKSEKTKYSKQKVLVIMIELLKNNFYVFKTAPTNISKKTHGEYPAITTQKIKSYSYTFNETTKVCDMNEVENSIGYNTYNMLKHTFTNSFGIMKAVLCRYEHCEFFNDILNVNYDYINPPILNCNMIEETYLNCNYEGFNQNNGFSELITSYIPNSLYNEDNQFNYVTEQNTLNEMSYYPVNENCTCTEEMNNSLYPCSDIFLNNQTEFHGGFQQTNMSDISSLNMNDPLYLNSIPIEYYNSNNESLQEMNCHSNTVFYY